MLITPEIMPNELLWGYMGRVVKLNGLRSQSVRKSLTEICRHARGPDTHVHGLGSTLRILSSLTELPEENFTRDHTLSHLVYFAQKYARYHPYEKTLGSKGKALEQLGGHLRFCDHCIDSDIQSHGFSYWKRDQQLPGHLWCQAHQAPLRTIYIDDPYLSSPATLRQECNPNELMPCTGENNPLIQHFLFLQRCVMWSVEKVDFGLILEVTRDRALELAYHFPSPHKRHLGKDMRTAYGDAWINDVIPQFSDITEDQHWWVSREAFHTQDKITGALLLMLTAAFLFDNDHLLSTLLAQALPKRKKRRYRKQIKLKPCLNNEASLKKHLGSGVGVSRYGGPLLDLAYGQLSLDLLEAEPPSSRSKESHPPRPPSPNLQPKSEPKTHHQYELSLHTLPFGQGPLNGWP